MEKIKIISEIINKWNLKANEIIYFGDSMTDYYAAKKSKIKFYCINGLNIKKKIEIYKDFNDFEKKNILKWQI